MKKLLFIFPLFLFLTSISYSQLIQTNGPSGGAVNNLLISGDSIYATVYNSEDAGYGAVYFSPDNGLNWRNISPHTPFWQVTCITKHNGMLYIGTYWAWGSHGVYMSSNNGANWFVANTIPGDAYVMNLFEFQNIVITSTNQGIFKTSNNGLSWQTVDGLPYCVEFKSDGLSLYAYVGSVGNACGPLNGNIGLYKSPDAGTTWQCISYCNTLDWLSALTFKNGIMFAAAGNHMVKSTNNGANWIQINDTVLTGRVTDLITAGNDIYGFTFYDIYKTTNDGANWQKIVTNINGAPVLTMAAKDNYIFAGAEKRGVYRSQDGGQNWIVVNNGIAATIVYSLCIHNGKVYAGTDFNTGIFSTSNNGVTWESANNGIGNRVTIWAIASSGNYLYAGGRFPDGGNTRYDVLTTTNEGANWRFSTDIQRTLYSMTTAGNNVYVGVMNYNYQYIYRSTNFGVNFSFATDGLIGTSYVHSLLTVNDSTIIAAAGDLWRTTNNGILWRQSDSGYVNTQIYALSTNDTLLYAGASTGDFYVSTNKGLNWVHKNNELNGKNIYCLAAFRNFVFAGLWYPGGLYMSTNYGDNWTSLNLDSLYVTSLVIKDQYLFVATLGYGVWRYTISQLVGVSGPPKEIPSAYCLYQNCPNPFNPMTTINYSIPKSGAAVIQVYDVNGKNVATLVNEYKRAGNYSVVFDASKLSSGVYFYTMQSGDFLRTKKMIVLK